MNSLLYSTIESVAYQNRFERSECGNGDIAVFASSQHTHLVAVIDDGCALTFYSPDNIHGLLEQFPDYASDDGLCLKHPLNDLTDHLILLSYFFDAAATLPVDATAPTRGTDALSVVKTRLGQQLYRTRLLERWGNACAVTGLTETRLIRASHAKPWEEATDEERLDSANGFPLAVNLDALFDEGLISFTDDGIILISPQLSTQSMRILAVTPDMHLRQPLDARQLQYLTFHRECVFLQG